MRPEDRDAAYVWDILEAGRSIGRFTHGVTFDEYLNDEKLRAAVERVLQVIEEAARRMSASFKAAHPEIPWQPIVAQRNILVHEYERVDYKRVWAVATVHVPELVALLEPLLPPLPPKAS